MKSTWRRWPRAETCHPSHCSGDTRGWRQGLADIIKLDHHRKDPDDAIRVVDRIVNVLGTNYTVRTTGDGRRGWFTVRDEWDRMMLAKPARFPPELVGDLILAWIDGRPIGRRESPANWTKRPPGGHRV